MSTYTSRPYQPRPYQTRCLTALAEARENGIQQGLVVMAGGLGKTATAIFDAEQYLDKYPNSRFLYLCDQETILIQNKQKFRAYFGEERSYGLYSGSSKTLHRVDFLFATLQSVRDHQEDFTADDYDYIIVDEAHHTSADTYEPVIRSFCPQFLLGLTATPDREDGRSILDVYQRILFEMDIYQGWAEGYLTRARYELMLDDVDEQQLRAYLGPEGAGLKISMTQLNRSIFVPRRDEEIVASARERIASAGIENPRIFAFCSNIAYAESMAKHFGDGAAVVHSDQSRALNEAILSDFRSGKLNTVIAVDMLNEGVDIPEANILIFLRATDTKRIFFQQLARGLRLSPGKDFALVLDYVINVQRIATVLEMEETSRARVQSNPAYPSSAKKTLPIVVNIPATPRFRIQRVDIERVLTRIIKVWTSEEAIDAYYNFCLEAGMWRSTAEIARNRDNKLPSHHVFIRLGIGSIRALQQCIWEQHPKEAQNFDDNSPTSLLSTRTLLHRYYLASVEAKHWLKKAEVDDNASLPSWFTYRNRVGGIQEVVAAAIGLFGDPMIDGGAMACSTLRRLGTLKASSASIMRCYFEASIEAGHWLEVREVDACSKLPCYGTIRKKYGSVVAFRQKVINEFGNPFDKKDLTIKQYYELCQKARRWIKLNELSVSLQNAIRRYVGKINDLKQVVREQYPTSNEWR